MGNRQTNAPESEALGLGDIEVFEAARSAVALLKKTFDTWVMIGRAVARARTIANERGGGKTFMRLIEQQGLAKIVDKATASRLERIMDNLWEVTKWHEGLTERQKIDWSAPTTVIKRCPVFTKPKPAKETLSPMPQLKQANIVLQEENHQLKQREDGDRWKPTDTAQDIARVMVDTLSPSKVKDVAKHMLEMLKGRASRAEKGLPAKAGKGRRTEDDFRRDLAAKQRAS